MKYFVEIKPISALPYLMTKAFSSEIIGFESAKEAFEDACMSRYSPFKIRVIDDKQKVIIDLNKLLDNCP